MSEPSLPTTVEASVISWGEAGIPPISRSQSIVEIKDGVKQSSNFDCVPPIPVGHVVDFPFDIWTDSWIDPLSLLHYFKPCGRTFGAVGSNAEFAHDGFEELFLRLHSNESLQMFEATGVEVSKTDASADWMLKRSLSLPRCPGATSVAQGLSYTLGMVAGTSIYPVKLPRHSHTSIEEPHSHLLTDSPHLHDFEGDTFDTDAAESGSGSGSAKFPLGSETMEANVNIELLPAKTNIQILEAGSDIDKMFVQMPGYGVAKMIFTGIIAIE